MTNSSQSAYQEIETLRKTVRMLSIGFVVLGAFCSLVLTETLAGRRVHADAVPDVITSKKFVLIDDKGNVRATLETGGLIGNGGVLSPSATQLAMVSGDGESKAALLTVSDEQPREGWSGVSLSRFLKDGSSSQGTFTTYANNATLGVSAIPKTAPGTSIMRSASLSASIFNPNLQLCTDQVSNKCHNSQ